MPDVPVEAGHCDTPTDSRSGIRPSLSSGSLDRTKRAGSCPRLFHYDGRLSVQLTDKVLGELECCKHLEDNEIDILIVLLKMFSSACAQSGGTEQTWREGIKELQIKCFNIQRRKCLSLAEERLLGQMAAVAFRNTTNNFLVLLNFPHTKPIQIARLPLERKKSDEGQNKSLFKARIDTGQCWLGHLPGAFNNELISTIFLNIDG